MRITWVQPEDLLVHELRQSADEGRDVAAVAARWQAAGGTLAIPHGGASHPPGPPALRALADRLLEALNDLPSPTAADEPDDLQAILATLPPASAAPVGAQAAAEAAAPDPAADSAPGDLPVQDQAAAEAAPGDLPAQVGAEAAAHGPAPDAADTPGMAAFPDGPRDRPSAAGAAGSYAAAVPGGGLRDRVLGGWLGRAAGCLLGKPVEKIPREGIREILEATGRWPLRDYFTAKGLPAEVAGRWPWNRASAATSLAEVIDGMPEDDDLNYALLALHVLEARGVRFTTEDVAAAWLALLPGGRVFTAERVAYRNLLEGIEPPATATRRNPYREWIGAQIRGDVYGWARPGDPRGAAALAWRDARLSHTRNGLYGAMYVAAMTSAACVADDIDTVLDAGRSVLPPRSRLAAAVDLARDLGAAAAAEGMPGPSAPTAEARFEAAVDALYATYGHLHWVHVLNNAALSTLALAMGQGEFTESVCRVVSGGWDTDSNGATVGSVIGTLHGAAALPDRWIGPLKNRLASSMPGFDGVGFDEPADRTLGVVT